MRISRLWLKDFRNYSELDIDLPSGLVFFLGSNGQGKTSLLEAIGYLTTKESIRSAPNEVIPRQKASPAQAPRLEAPAIVGGSFVSSRATSSKLTASIPATGRLQLKLNDAKSATRAQLQSSHPVTPFLSGHIDLIAGPAANRREVFDKAVLLAIPNSQDTYQELTQVLKQRNALLRSLDSSADVAELLDVYDSQLAQHGEEWATFRCQAIPELEVYMSEMYGAISGENANLKLKYVPSWAPDTLASQLHQARSQDLLRKTTTVGPHKDDLEIYLEDLPARHTASRGEQRSLAISLVFGIHNLISQKGEVPILLLDDVLSEFDIKRANALLQNIQAEQALITSASWESIQIDLPIARIFEVVTDGQGRAQIQTAHY